ncbi:MAG: hypothetical protein KJ970_07855 [Candidatus Eisenbacteria bacterium]|uniref:Uncharacterized protein n=1 Tax=Eiseniibacteriota bacterium TaxID=2212470 RepID=A0A948RTP9_UNCEI|nr:hypothetical protein [Candidatus Eisenbacteria bacterium]MBU2690830.1 hypothetical protein [Candidatus Eisenbacteria bacterium]
MGLDSVIKHLALGDSIKQSLRRWQSYFARARESLKKIIDLYRSKENIDSRLEGYELLDVNNNIHIDPMLAEALLQYGDKTDITISRLHRPGQNTNNSPLHTFLEAISHDEKEGYLCVDIARSILSPFARYRASRFLPVDSIRINPAAVRIHSGEKPNAKNEIVPAGLDIVITYWWIESWADELFRLIRYHNEKDFYDLGFLDVIRFNIPLFFSKLNTPIKRNKDPIPVIRFFYKKHTIKNNETNNLDNIEAIDFVIGKLKSASSRFPFTSENIKALRSCSPSSIHQKKLDRPPQPECAFYETADGLIPGSFEILAILNTFLDLE